MRLVQHDRQSPLASVIVTGARRRLDRSGYPSPGGIRDLQHRALGASRIVHKYQSGAIVQQGTENVRAGLDSDQGPIDRIVEMVGPFMTTEAPREDTIIHALDTRRPDRVRLLPFGPLLLLRPTASRDRGSD